MALLEKALHATNAPKKLDKSRAEKLFGSPAEFSISRLESFAQCGYKHFIQYGISPADSKFTEVNPIDWGTVFHTAMEMLADDVAQSGLDWSALSADEIEKRIDRIYDDLLDEYSHGKLFYTFSNRAAARKMKRAGTKTAVIAAEHIKKGSFRPVEYEVKFGHNKKYPPLVLSFDKANILLKGKIDRVDLMEKDGVQYLRIIDYKMGSKDIDITKVVNGLQIQLFVYIRAALNAYPGAVPAGVFYYTLQDGVVTLKSTDDIEKIEQSKLEKAQLKGLFINEPAIIEGLDPGFESKSTIVPLTKKKDKTVKSKSLVAKEVFEKIIKLALDKAIEASSRILNGDNPIEPYKFDRTSTSCKYCSYIGICGFDERFSGNSYRKLIKINLDDMEVGG